ncbi:MAG: apolipoprotein N-acyltransferase [Aquificae bacterium]|nr:apolipoprotein N-acyltransferase [Aquificota bacterium]
MHRPGHKEILLGILSGLLFYLSFSKLNLFFLLPLSLLIGVSVNPYRFFTFGFSGFFLSLYWLRIPLVDYGGINPFLGHLLVFLLVLFLVLYQFLVPYLLWRFSGFSYLAFGFIYVGFEWLRSHFPYGGFPWLILGKALVDVPYLSLSLSLSGVYGGSLLVLLLSLLPKMKRKERLWALSLSLPLLISPSLAPKPTLPPEGFRVALVQPAVPEEIKLSPLFEKTYPKLLEQVKRAIEENADLVILPESAVPFYLDELRTKGKELLELSKKAPIILGIIEIQEEERIKPYNAVVLLKDGKLAGVYRKNILVPFGEFTPPPFDFFSRLVPYLGLQDYERGDKVLCFEVKSVRVGTPVCFEVAYGDFVSRFPCELMAVLTNDAWFRDSDGNYQHLKWARVRAVENRKFFLWVNNIGPSAVINPDGKIIKKTPYGVPDVLIYTF